MPRKTATHKIGYGPEIQAVIILAVVISCIVALIVRLV